MNKMIEKIKAVYLIHQGLISFFAGVNRQFESLMQPPNINAKTADAFLMLFEQHIRNLSGLKFQIGSIKSSEHAESENLIRYCREEMTLSEVESCLSKFETVKTKSVEIPPVCEPEPVSSYINSLGMQFVYIPPGTFMMGSPLSEPERNRNETQHKVTLTKGFYMQTTQVTQRQWKSILENNPSQFKGGIFKENRNDCPVEHVSWRDVHEFIRKLSEIEGYYSYRLPTEAEWEYACRAGTTTPFAFGECLSTDQANYDGNYPLEGCPKGIYREKTIPVGYFSPNAWGLYDMHGNVWELCQDWYADNYPSVSVTDPMGSDTGSLRVIRGGSWYDRARYCRSARRSGSSPVSGSILCGFRLVRSE